MSERYADVALAHILAVKEYAPEAEFFPVLVNNDSAADGMVWNRVIASKLGKYVNAGVLHIYYGVSFLPIRAKNDLYG